MNMKVISRFLLRTTALPALLVGPAMAADMAVKAPPPAVAAPSAYNWTGFYLGVNAGGAWAHSGDPSTTLAPGGYLGAANAAALAAGGTGSMSASTFTGGVQPAITCRAITQFTALSSILTLCT
jgi:outer membrane immunogenic protein